MNQLEVVIQSIETEENVSLVTVGAAGISFSTLVIDTPATAPYLQEGNSVIMIFKETAMSVAKNLSGDLSIRNHFPGVITVLQTGKVLTSVTIDCLGYLLTAVITTQSANKLALKAGDNVEGLVKTNDISLMQKE